MIFGQAGVTPSDPLGYCAWDRQPIPKHSADSRYYTPLPGVVMAFCSGEHEKAWHHAGGPSDEPLRWVPGPPQDYADVDETSPPEGHFEDRAHMAEEWEQEGRQAPQKLARLAYEVCQGLGVPVDDNPSGSVPYHAQAMAFLQALQLMVDRGLRKGHTYEGLGYEGSFVDIKRKYDRLKHVVWDGHTNGDPRALEPHNMDGAWGDAIDLLNHTGFFLQCLQAHNPRGHRW